MHREWASLPRGFPASHVLLPPLPCFVPAAVRRAHAARADQLPGAQPRRHVRRLAPAARGAVCIRWARSGSVAAGASLLFGSYTVLLQLPTIRLQALPASSARHVHDGSVLLHTVPASLLPPNLTLRAATTAPCSFGCLSMQLPLHSCHRCSAWFDFAHCRRSRWIHDLLAGQPPGTAGAIFVHECKQTAGQADPHISRCAEAAARDWRVTPANMLAHSQCDCPVVSAAATAGGGAGRARGERVGGGLAPGGPPAGHGSSGLRRQVLVQASLQAMCGGALWTDVAGGLHLSSRCGASMCEASVTVSHFEEWTAWQGCVAMPTAPPLHPLPRRCRPGDPFFEQQQEEQRELAALAAEAEPVAAPRPAALAPPSATFGPAGAAAGGAIPGIGDAVAMPTLPQATAVVDVFSIQQQPYDARGGRAPAAGAGPAAGGQRGQEEEHRR